MKPFKKNSIPLFLNLILAIVVFIPWAFALINALLPLLDSTQTVNWYAKLKIVPMVVYPYFPIYVLWHSFIKSRNAFSP